MKKEYDFTKGRRGPVIHQRGKTRITIHIDDEVLEAFRERADAAGRGYQTMINEALREHLGRSGERVNADTIRRIVREELRKTGRYICTVLSLTLACRTRALSPANSGTIMIGLWIQRRSNQTQRRLTAMHQTARWHLSAAGDALSLGRQEMARKTGTHGVSV